MEHLPLPKALPQLIAALFAVLAAQSARAAAGKTFTSATGQLITLNEVTCSLETKIYRCGDFDPDRPAYKWTSDTANNCSDTKCQGWLASSQNFCQGAGGGCRGLAPGMTDAKGVDTWNFCFRTCDSKNSLDRFAVCTGCNAIAAAKSPKDPKGSGVDPDIAPAPDSRTKGTVGDLNAGPARQHDGACTNEQCLRESAEANRRAEEEARQRRLAYLKAERDARDAQQSSITSATGLLDSWKRRLDAGGSTVTTGERSRYYNDQRLVAQAQAAVSGSDGSARGSFTAEDALKANDPDIMRQLAMNTEFHDQEKTFAEDVKQTQVEEQNFHSLAVETLRRADGLYSSSAAGPIANGSEPAGGGLGSYVPGSNALGRGSLSGASGPEAENSQQSRKISAADSLPDRGTALGSGRIAAGASGPSLRDLLKSRLGEHRQAGVAVVGGKGGSADRDALEGNSFGGANLAPVARGPHVRNGGGEAARTSIAEEVMAGYAALPGRKGFALGSSETEAEVRRLTQQAQGAPEGGLLGMDTASLFERVRQAHQACVARSCVR